MKRVWIYLLLAAFVAGCGSLGKVRNTEEFVVEVTGYRMWKEVYYFDGRVDSQWMLVCTTVSPKARSLKELDIIVTERDRLFQCPTGTVLRCEIDRRAVAAWERVVRRETKSLDLPALRSSAEDLELKAKALERAHGRTTPVSSDVAGARQTANEAKDKLRQAELYYGAIVVNAADILRFEVMKEGPGN